jgi:phosphate-selective porin OprO and OprP
MGTDGSKLASLVLALALLAPLGAAADEPVAAVPVVNPSPDAGVHATFGRGVTFGSDDGDFTLTLRGRIQTRATTLADDALFVPETSFAVRRSRVVLLAGHKRYDLVFYVQLGFAPEDMEPDLLIPLRDAVVTWTPLRDVNLRVGQMKVPFNRERVISSSALQFPDRTILNAELNLDRDIGAQLFSEDLLGVGGRLAYRLGVFGGEGRNRPTLGTGMLYVARIEVRPVGTFEDEYVEVDHARSGPPRLAFGASLALNNQSRRQRSTHGAFRADEVDLLHAQADLIFKWAGFSVQAELLARQPTAPEEGLAATRAAVGFMMQAGYLTSQGIELAGRVAEVSPMPGVASEVELLREMTGALSYYVLDHSLKVQADYGYLFGARLEGGRHLARVQLQLFY